jgi:predicted DNA-binding transcriptional regulator AlpA
MDKETGKKLTIPEIADVVGMKKSVMYHRFYKHGVSAFGNRFEEIPRNA